MSAVDELGVAVTPTLRWGFAALAILMACGFVVAVYRARRLDGDRAAARRWATRAAVGATAWMALTGGLAASGRLAFGPMPPPAMLLFVGMTALVVGVGCSRVGARLAALPMWVLVGFQGFRLPVELLLHHGASIGVVPGEMSWAGYNFDVLTGLSALALGAVAYRGRLPRAAVIGFEVVGSALLATIVVVSILATPAFGVLDTDPPNVWITDWPFIWLPAVLVALALLGHIVLFRRLVGRGARTGGDGGDGRHT